MKKQTALQHYDGSASNLARALDISRQAVCKWPEVVPIDKAIKLQKKTKGKLKVELELYSD